MQNAKIPVERVMKLAGDVQEHLELVTLEEGLRHFMSRSVNQIAVEGSIVRAMVREGDFLHTVRINLNKFSNSTCTCWEGNFCKHIAAAFFYLYAHHKWPSVFISECRNNKCRPPVNKKPANAVPKFVQEDKLRSGEPVEVWYNYFDREFEQMDKPGEEYIEHWDYYSMYHKNFYNIFLQFRDIALPVSENWPKAEKSLYRFHGMLYILTRLEKLSQKYGNIYMDPIFLEEFEQELIANFPEPLPEYRQKLYEPFLQKAKDIVRTNFQQRVEQLFNWSVLYRLMWTTLFNDQHWIKKEIMLLEKLLKNAPKGSGDFCAAVIGLAHFKVMAKKDEEAWAIIQKIDYLVLDALNLYLYMFSESEQWERLLEWLRRLKPLISTAAEGDFNMVCDCWVIAAEKGGAQEECLNTLKGWLPRSFDVYNLLLLELRQYKTWADLQINYWSDLPGGVPTEELYMVEAQEPSALLPLYHQWVVRLIEQRNRKSYQEAVKLLRKLRTLYKKLKLIEEWKVYVPRLVSRYSRMKALQEEMRKGNLIS